ncbi:MAG: hypothetical protein WD512_08610, partial [Candidatus Paceibacterota bacterium]
IESLRHQLSLDFFNIQYEYIPMIADSSVNPMLDSDKDNNTYKDKEKEKVMVDRLPVISTNFDETDNWDQLTFFNVPEKRELELDLDLELEKSREPKFTTLLRDLFKERLDAIKRKIITNMDNYEVVSGKIIINSLLANILYQFKEKSTRHVNIIHDIQERFPTVFYLPELIRVLETQAS